MEMLEAMKDIVEYKTDQEREEFHSEKLNKRLRDIVLLLAYYSWTQFGKRILITEVYRSPEENAKLYNNLGAYLFFQGRYEQAAQAFERTLQFEGNTQNYFYWANMADAYRWVPGKTDDAELAYRRAIQLIQSDISERPYHPGLHSRMALYAAKGGDASLAKSSLAIAVAPPVSQPIIFYRATVTEEILGNRASAIHMLERAIDAGYALNEISNDPELAMLRQDPAYQQLLARKGITHG